MTCHKLLRNGLDVQTVTEPLVDPQVRYRLVAEQEEDLLRLTVNGQEVFRLRDFFPLNGERMGLYTAGAGARFSRVTTYTAGVPRQRSCLAIPDHYAAKSLWRDALHEYQRIIHSYPGSPEAAAALFKAGQCLLSMSDPQAGKAKE